jgi:putative redox protein
MAMNVTVKWIDSDRFVGESGSGHAVVMEGAPGEGEVAVGIRPMEMLLLGMGGCTAYDVVSILAKSREKITGCVVEIEAERAGSAPKVFTRIHAHYIVTGHGLKQSAVARAVQLSAEKYCSATVMMTKVADVTHDFEIVAAAV